MKKSAQSKMSKKIHKSVQALFNLFPIISEIIVFKQDHLMLSVSLFSPCLHFVQWHLVWKKKISTMQYGYNITTYEKESQIVFRIWPETMTLNITLKVKQKTYFCTPFGLCTSAFQMLQAHSQCLM